MLNWPIKNQSFRKRIYVPIIVFSLLCIFMAILLRYFQNSRRDARDMEVTGQVFSLAFALNNYLKVHGSYPPPFGPSEDGHLEHSWRVYLLHTLLNPLVSPSTEYDFGKPWNSPENMQWANSQSDTFIAYYRANQIDTSDSQTTSFVALARNVAKQNLNNSSSDENAKTIQELMILAVCNSGIHWLNPNDFSPNDTIKEIQKRLPNNSHIKFCTTKGISGEIYKNQVVLKGNGADFLKLWIGSNEIVGEDMELNGIDSSD